MQIKLITTEHDMAEKLMIPIQNQVITLRDCDSNAGSIKWGGVEVERGAIETIFELLGSLQLENLSLGIVSGIIANWLWSFLQKSHLQKPNEEIRVEVIYINDGVTKIVKIKCNSLETMKASLSLALESQKK